MLAVARDEIPQRLGRRQKAFVGVFDHEPLAIDRRALDVERHQALAAVDEATRKLDNRVEQVRWFLPQERVLRRYLNPELVNQERDETQQAMNMYLRSDDGIWESDDWGGIMRA